MKILLKSIMPLMVAFASLFASCSELKDFFEHESDANLTSALWLSVDTYMLEEGDEGYLKVNVVPEFNKPIIVWSSSDTTLVKVDAFGRFRAIHEGKAVIKATAPDSGVCDSCTVTVKRFTRCLAFSTENGSGTSVFNMTGMRADIEYSYNRADWIPYKEGTALEFGKETLYLRGQYNNNEFSGIEDPIGHIHFEGDEKVRCTGSIMNLLNYHDSDCRTLFRPNILESLFEGCVQLTEAPELPATTLSDGCYAGMFMGCTGLTKAPALPATTLNYFCYACMFTDCTSLAEAPAILPADTMKFGCCEYMFANCRNLTSAPELPATKMQYDCYYGMFYGCTALTEAPALPAAELAWACYKSMFENCSALTKAPELLARKLEDDCYSRMFAGCQSLTYIKAMFEDCSGQETTDMMDPVSQGTFVKNAAATWPNELVIKPGWSVQYASE